MFSDPAFHESPSGARLAYHHQPSANGARGIVLICHGLAEHSRRYEAFAIALSERGYHVYAHDHRGHGETTAPDAAFRSFARKDGASKVIADVMAMRELAVQSHPGLPVILFGHSMGGLIALNVATEHPQAFHALSIWNSNFNPGLAGRFAQGVLSLEQMLKGSDVPSTILPKATFAAWGRAIKGHRTAFDWLSHDAGQVDAYIADPLCGFDASVSMWRDIFRLTFAGADPERLARLPQRLAVYLVGGAEDPATNNGREIRWLGQRMLDIGMTDVETNVYEGMRHETLNEVGREKAITDFLTWLDNLGP
ncbi:alpha-beta hydrolase superfamily lysophospholipase [Rhizobium rosettiformans]|uniref:Alpha/beta hydrolase n=2 Tax=Rhizobium rosettiformans TaxID=1368430 RepID=A0A4S8PWQ8_9HYPH|nr:alpha/beta hydrolase [Rhizobium rosettiformans]MBB5278037.1 alpha-beta hydrolase superfamily lysophospholipase [Rhizobium rosettiformans]THV32639.1 alpha/beta hydrolase [Rhizobium rosettiformans W3]